MDQSALNAVAASALSSVVGLAGGFLLLAKYEGVKRWSRYFVSFAAGALLGAAFFDVLTEVIGEHPDKVTAIFSWVMAGFFLFFVIEKIVLRHHHGDEAEERHNHAHLIPLNIIGDAVHNFVDGTIIATTFLVSPAVGITTAIAVFFHEIPREIGDFSIMIYAGMSRRGVAVWNILGALVSPAAAIITLLVAERVQGIQLPLLGIAAGNFIYIAAADLIPEIHEDKSKGSLLKQMILLLAGLLIIVWLSRHFGG